MTEVEHAAAEAAAPRENLGAARRANRIGRHGSREHGTALDQLVEVRRPDVGVAKRVDRIRTLVIAEDEDDVRP